METLKVVMGIWFATSVVFAVGGNLVLYLWLLRRGAPIRFIWAGTPGYLDHHYRKWCEANGRSPRAVIRVRWVSLVNALVAFAAFRMTAAGR